MKKILLADDDSDFRSIFKGILEDEGYAVVDATDGTQAFELFKTSSPDLVVLDLQMPGMDGLKVTKEIREINPVVPIIILTGHGDIPSAITATKMGALDFICKPPDFEVLIAIIRAALETSLNEILSPRELDVLNLLKEGKKNYEIAAGLNISINTVGTHRTSILRKLNAAGSTQAVAKAIRMGLIPLETIKLGPPPEKK